MEFVKTFRQEMHDLYRFYLDEDRRRKLARMNRLERALWMITWLLKSLFLRLTPFRRIMTVTALILIPVSFQYNHGGYNFRFNTSLLSAIILLLVLMLELKDKLTAHHELEMGRTVQLALLPQQQPVLSGWDIWIYTRPANHVGGDLVDYLPLPENRLGIALGDVAGKGLPAALLMAKLQATIRASAAETADLPVLGERLNRIFCRDGLPNRFATLLFLRMTPGSGEIKLLNAGHLPPLMISGTRIREIPPVAVPLGVLPDSTYIEQTVWLEPGELLAGYSDGLEEAQLPSGEFYGEDRLKTLLASLSGLTSAETGARILQSVETFLGEIRPHDDLSLVLARRLAPSPADVILPPLPGS